jgi:erythromycin esterase-like protein
MRPVSSKGNVSLSALVLSPAIGPLYGTKLDERTNKLIDPIEVRHKKRGPGADRDSMLSNAILSEINRAAVPLSYDSADYDPLLKWVGSRKLVLLGQATHGTHDFYRDRAGITRRLIEEKGFNVVALEADWAPAHRVHRFSSGLDGDADCRDAMRGFLGFPAWMWRNMDVLAFVDWLRHFNRKHKPRERIGFYGLDFYSTRTSMHAVLDYLDKADPEGARRARLRYSRFDDFGDDPQANGHEPGLSDASKKHTVTLLVELQRRRAELASRDSRMSPQDSRIAEQITRLSQNSEHYYRAMVDDNAEIWNLRGRHMAETLDWIEQLRPDAKVVVWAHNSHAGDARATRMFARGKISLGQLARERHGYENVYLLGFSTNSGEVTAASAWDRPAERKIVRNALEDSYEGIFHRTQIPAFLLPLHGSLVEKILAGPMLARAIGVVYQPGNQRDSHYFQCDLPAQFDAIVHFDRTQALVPFERTSGWEAGEAPEAYPYTV